MPKLSLVPSAPEPAFDTIGRFSIDSAGQLRLLIDDEPGEEGWELDLEAARRRHAFTLIQGGKELTRGRSALEGRHS